MDNAEARKPEVEARKEDSGVRAPKDAAAEASTRGKASRSPARRFELGDLATNRILFALALLGVLLPLNSIVGHYHHFDFIYHAPHALLTKGPYNFHALSYFYFMEGLLACAVYLYAFDFIFPIMIFERIGTILYAVALLVPPLYFFLWVQARIVSAMSGLPVVLSTVISSVLLVVYAIAFFYAAKNISNRIRD